MIHQWTYLHEKFISELFQELENNGICYFILRNYEELPERNLGKDVDIVIAPKSYEKTKKVLLRIMSYFNIQYYQITQFDKMRCWYIMDYVQKFGIHIDIIENEVYKGFEFFSFDHLYKNTQRFKNFVVLNKTMDATMLLIQNIVAYKSLKNKYRITIAENYSHHKDEIDKEIILFWGEKLGHKMIDSLNRSDFDAIVKDARTYEKGAMKSIFYKCPFHTLKGIIRFFCGKFYRIVWCPKKFWRFFAVEAPDGTGKTTFINSLIEELRKYYVSDEGRFCVHHFRPNLLPNLGAAGEKAGIKKQDTNFTDPHRAKPVGVFSSVIRMTYYWLDYVIGIPYLLRKEVQYEKYSIYDRYIYDFVVDPQRSRINLPDWLRKLYACMVIQPQIIFILYADFMVIYKRKQELTIDEIARQQMEFKKLASVTSNAVYIDANRSIQEMVDEACKIIFDKFFSKLG